jgi:predicted porin
MKKLVLALMLAAGFGVAQAADQIQVYGIIDAGVVVTDGVGTGGKQNATEMVSGTMYTSRFGVKGTEDLGNGLQAGFNLEMQVMPNDGTQGASSSSGAPNGPFQRASNVSLGGSFGKVTLGRQVSAAYQSFLVGDVQEGRNFGTGAIFYLDGSSFGGTTTKSGVNSLTGSSFLSNAVRYDTPAFGPVSGTLFYTVGGVAGDGTLGNTDASSRRIAIVNFNQGALKSSVFYNTADDSAGNEVATVYGVGANYTVGKAKIGAGYTSLKNPSKANQANSNFDLIQLTGAYRVAPKIELSAGFYDLSDKQNGGNDSKITSLMASYEFSKRTNAYAGVAHSQNRGTSGFSAFGGGSANLNSQAGAGNYPSVYSTAGFDQTAYTIGLVHRF